MISISFVLLFLVVWQIAPTVGWINPIYVPTPTAIFSEMVRPSFSGVLINDAAISMTRIFLGLGLAVIVALPMGFLLGGWFRSVETAVNPLIYVFSVANPFTLLPVFMTLLGVGELSKVAVIFLGLSISYPFQHHFRGQSVDPDLIKMGRATGLSRLQISPKCSYLEQCLRCSPDCG